MHSIIIETSLKINDHINFNLIRKFSSNREMELTNIKNRARTSSQKLLLYEIKINNQASIMTINHILENVNSNYFVTILTSQRNAE